MIEVEHPPAGDLDVARRQSRAGRVRNRLAVELAAVVISPFALFTMLRAEPFSRQNGIDPFIYLGYSFDQKNLFARYGPTYYGVRFGLLFPIKITTRLFGTVGGYYVLRYALALLAAGTVYAALRRTHGRGTAALGGVLLLTSPMFLRALMTAYSDTTGVPYLTASLALVVLTVGMPPSRARTVALGAVGLLVALAAHSNPVNVAVGGIVVFCATAVELPRRRWRTAGDLAALALPAVLVTAAAAGYYEWRFGTGNIAKPSIDAIHAYSGANGESFLAPTNDWLWYRFHLYIAPLTLASWVILRARHRRDVTSGELVVMGSLVLTYALLVVQQFGMRNASLEVYFYTSSLTGPMVLALVFTIAAALRRNPAREQITAALAALAVLLPLVRNIAWPDFEFDFGPWVPLLVLLCLGAVTLVAVRGPGLAAAPTTFAATAAVALVVVNTAFLFGAPRNPPLTDGQTFRFDPHFESALGNPDYSGLDWYKLTHDLVRQTPDLASDEGTVLFWYPDSDNIINSLQSAFLWRQSALMSTGPGMPFLDDWRINRLVEQRARWLVTLAERPASLDEGLAALRARDVKVLRVEPFQLRSGKVVIYGATLVLDPPPA
jgi:hypothetical protein